jgi:diacylglycerol kinase (ATP)
MAGIGLISNPYSRRNRKNPDILNRLVELSPDKDLVRLPVSYEEMDDALNKFKKRKVDVLAVNGGDGTVHIMLSRMIKIYGDEKLPDIAILKGGTMNQTATNLRIRGNSEAIFKRIIKAYRKKGKLKTRNVSLLSANDKYGFIFGSGSICTFMDIYHRSGDPSPLVAGKSLLNLVGSIIVKGDIYKKIFTPVSQKITVDGFSFGKTPYLATLVSTIPEVGLRFELMTRAKCDYTKAHMVSFHEGAKIIPQIPRAWLGLSLPPDMIDDTVGRKFVFESDTPFKYTIDGDFYTSSGNLLLKTGPALNIVVE